MYELNLFSENKENLSEFLNKFYNSKIDLSEPKFEKEFGNPIDMIDLISAIVDNNDKYNIGIWISIDKNIFINITELNLDKVIRYILERYPL